MRFYSFFCTTFLLVDLACWAGNAGAASDTVSTGSQSVTAGENLPDLGGTTTSQSEFEQTLSQYLKGLSSANDTSTDDSSAIFKDWAFDNARDYVSSRVAKEAQSLLAPAGQASFSLLVDQDGNFAGTQGALFTPWNEDAQGLTWTQLSISDQDEGVVGNAGIGQRWNQGNWLVGYNSFYDLLMHGHEQRGGLGAELWGQSLRLSANYYYPLTGWHNSSTTRSRRLARGYDINARAWLPFYHHISTTVSFEQYFGQHVDLFDSGTGYHNPYAVNVGLNYTPVPLLTLTAQHKQGENGEVQNNLGLKVNYRFGVALDRQLSADEVATVQSLRGSRYDAPERNNIPVLEYKQRKTLSVWLATPPWDLQASETVSLKIELRNRYGIRNISWQGDTQALSLTAPTKRRDTTGWTVIMPQWNDAEGATNQWRLSVIIEDTKGQKVTSNWITLKLTPPVTADIPGNSIEYKLLPEEN